VEGATSGVALCLGDIASLVIHPYTQAKALSQQVQMTSGAAADIDDPHAFPDGIPDHIELGPQESLDGGRLSRRVERPVQ
jgi:hypothetical protein